MSDEITSEMLADAWIKAAKAEWRRPVLDIQPGREDDRERIEQYYRDLGWGWFIDSQGEEGYDEAPESWCGIGQAWVARFRIGDHLFDDRCVDVRLRPSVATKLLPGTDRLYSRRKWESLDLQFPDQPDVWELRRGDVITVGDGEDGSHIALIRSAPNTALQTIEANSVGHLGDGTQGEGWIIQARGRSEVRQTYRLAVPRYFEGVDDA